jgi:protein SCO1/2
MRRELATLLSGLFAQAPPDPPRLRITDSWPNVDLINQFGQELRFRDAFLADDRALIINPMYTTCRGSCPGTSATLEELRETLAPVFGRRLAFVSFSVDPVVDRPARLLSYAKLYGAGEAAGDLPQWQFVTGTPEGIDALRRALGFFDLDPRVDRDPARHAATLLFGNSRTDRWSTLPSGLRTPLLVETIRRVAGTTFEQRYGIRG